MSLGKKRKVKEKNKRKELKKVPRPWIIQNVQVVASTAFDNNNPTIWRLGDKSVESGIYLAMTDAHVPLRFNISDLSTIGEIFIIFEVSRNLSLKSTV